MKQRIKKQMTQKANVYIEWNHETGFYGCFTEWLTFIHQYTQVNKQNLVCFVQIVAISKQIHFDGQCNLIMKMICSLSAFKYGQH